ncbi:MAG: Twin-arginine translocation pathway signal [Ideonella sp. MAG2]|nr:MAG: Twin-arginine translocation pathway signal [Ideonella sp. MAG2]
MTPLKPSRRHFVVGSLALATSAATGVSWAQAGKTIKLLVGFPAGGGTDAIARVLAEHLKNELGANIVVENKVGAGGQLAAQALKAATPDGLTLFLSHDHSISILPQTIKTPGYDPAKDFVPVVGFASFVAAMAVSGGTPVKDYKDYVAWLRGAGQGKGAVGIPAPASTPEFLVKALGQKHALDLVPVPYRGSAPMMADMLGNQIAAGVGSVPDFIDNHRSGKIKVVAVGGIKRQGVLPDVPTFHELGVQGFEEVPYYGVFAPTGTPRAFIDSFSAAMAKVLDKREVRARMLAMGLTPGYMSPEQLGQRERDYTAAWARIIKSSGFSPQ